MAPRTKKVADAEASAPEKTSGATVADVITASGKHDRSYTLEDHGEQFEALAHERATQFPGATVTVH